MLEPAVPTETFFNLPAAKRARIIECAFDAFAAASYREASLSQIVRAAGISKGSAYQYFENKLDLYRWLVTDELGRRKLAAIGRRTPPDTDDFFDVLEYAIIGGIDFAESDPRLSRLAMSLMEPVLDPDLVEVDALIRQRGHEWLRTHITTAQARGQLRGDLNPEITAGIMARIIGPCVLDAIAALHQTDVSTYIRDNSAFRPLRDDEKKFISQHLLLILRSGVAKPPSP